ncbi:hypothetical protein HW132_35580 [Brasilonema sp. CT11]|nr:hypothetical protein [Brasilonema sp. CT11]
MAIWGTEHLVDWTKHSFIAKFNKIPAFSYHKFRVVLYSDVIDARKIGSLDPVQNTARRLGFIPFPLCCLVSLNSIGMAKVVIEKTHYANSS